MLSRNINCIQIGPKYFLRAAPAHKLCRGGAGERPRVPVSGTQAGVRYSVYTHSASSRGTSELGIFMVLKLYLFYLFYTLKLQT